MDVRETTLTFLFTDIEGSTRLWEAHPEAMRLALATHDAILRDIIDAEGGRTFKTVGDAFYASFPGAGSAFRTAIAVQRALAAEDWKDLGTLRVRMAIHSGSVESRGGDYFGRPLNRVARILGLAHGGQVLVSAAARAFGEGDLPPGAGLRDMGTFQLRGVGARERVSQLTHADLLDDFPSIPSEEGPSNLPRELSRFLGRDEELMEVDELLDEARLVTLSGGGGTGKTRLAIQVGEGARGRFRDGVWLVEFAGIRSGGSVASEISAIVGIRDMPGRTVEASLLEGLSEREMLLVLDNCEHLVADVATLVARLLRGCPKLRILATSREILGVAGERTFRVPPLSMPRQDGNDSLESLARCESVQLFVERATAALPQFALSSANAVAVSQVCRELDGMPLALELAAARVRALPVEKLAERLGDRFRLLTAGPRTADRRQQTLRGLIDWSYDLLTPSEQILLRALPAFAGGWDIEAVETVAPAVNPAIEPWETLDGLQSLVDKSLVIFDEPTGRYRLLETVRQYAWERAEEAGELPDSRKAHADWALDRAIELGAQLTGPGQIQASERLDADHDNLRAAHAFLVESRDTDSAQRIVASLALFWDTHSFLTEGAARCLESLTLGTGPWRLGALLGAGRLLHLHADATALPIYAEALDLALEVGDRRSEAQAINGLGAWAYINLDYEESERRYREALSLRGEIDDASVVSSSIHGLGNIALRRQEFDEAQAFFEEALALRRTSGDVRGTTLTTGALGQLAMKRGNLDTAERLSREVARHVSELKIRWTLAIVLSTLASIAEDRGQTLQAVELMGARNRVRELTAYPLPEAERAGAEKTLAVFRETLGEDVYHATYRSGYERTWEGALALALEEGEDIRS